MTIERAAAADLPGLLSLLDSVGLPREGVAEHLSGFIVAREAAGRVVGCVGMERRGPVALLRSAAVAPEAQGAGLGRSAGVSPTGVRAEAVAAMRELGIDIAGRRSKSVDEFAGRQFDYVITVCDHAREQCPVSPASTRRVHWSLDDPAAAVGDESERLAVFRRVRDEIRARLGEFVAAETAAP